MPRRRYWHHWRKDGWVTVMALEATKSMAAEAKRLGCSHFLAEAGPEPIQEEHDR